MSRALAVLLVLALCLGTCAAHSRALLGGNDRGQAHGGNGNGYSNGYGNGGGRGDSGRPRNNGHGYDDHKNNQDNECEDDHRGWASPSPAAAPGTISYPGWQPNRTASWCIPDQNTTFCNGTALKAMFTSARIVPDLLGPCEMRYTVGVKLGFPGRLDVVGTYVNKSAAIPPTVSFGSNFNATALHTLIMLDPDASANWNAANGPILHWLVTNVANGNVDSGNVAQPFRAPGPAFGNGLHRYTLLLLSQPGPITVAPVNQTDPAARRQYDLYRLMRTNNLKVLGGTFFYSQF